MQTLTLATWNVMGPVSARRQGVVLEHIAAVSPDVIVLTEAFDTCAVEGMHVHSSAPGRDGRHLPGHRWVTICSRFPLATVSVSDEQRTAAARVMPPDGPPFMVVGTVLPWVGSSWREHPATAGTAFREALALQVLDWRRIRAEFPGEEFFVLGDFNQELVSPRYYGSKANRMALETALAGCGLRALTAGENDPIRRDSPPCACIDHICGRVDSAWVPARTIRWPEAATPDKRLTDHFGVGVALRNAVATDARDPRSAARCGGTPRDPPCHPRR